MGNYYLVNNFLSRDLRENLLKEVKPLLVDGTTLSGHYGSTRGFPGKQTYPTLHLHPSFNELVEKIIKKVKQFVGKNVDIDTMWCKWTNGKREYVNWHNHLPCDYSCVYYLHVPFFIVNGTLFREKFVRASQNSLLIFPSKWEHSTPPYMGRGDRYVISADFVVK